MAALRVVAIIVEAVRSFLVSLEPVNVLNSSLSYLRLQTKRKTFAKEYKHNPKLLFKALARREIGCYSYFTDEGVQKFYTTPYFTKGMMRVREGTSHTYVSNCDAPLIFFIAKNSNRSYNSLFNLRMLKDEFECITVPNQITLTAGLYYLFYTPTHHEFSFAVQRYDIAAEQPVVEMEEESIIAVDELMNQLLTEEPAEEISVELDANQQLLTEAQSVEQDQLLTEEQSVAEEHSVDMETVENDIMEEQTMNMDQLLDNFFTSEEQIGYWPYQSEKLCISIGGK